MLIAAFSRWLPAFLQLSSWGSSGERVVLGTEACWGRLGVAGCSGDKLAFPSLVVLSPSTPVFPTTAALSAPHYGSLSNPLLHPTFAPPAPIAVSCTHISPSPHSADRSTQPLCCNISAEWSGWGRKGGKKKKKTGWKLCSTQQYISITLFLVIWMEKSGGKYERIEGGEHKERW